ncbi:MAG: hypothetical protein Q9190_003748 [Brigantiaea leucoxantha]
MARNNAEPDFSAADGQGYMLSYDHTAACRLNLQFYLWRDTLGFNIHPVIELDNSSCVADIACGTGSWLIDVARSLPDAQLDGFDINLAQAPHTHWLPRNISLRPLDILQDIPDNLLGKYDLVHVRLLVLVVQQVDPKSILKKLHKMLKPGGYLQWDDLDCVNMCVKRVSQNIPSPALDKLREMSWSGGRHDWILTLAELAAECGFVNTKMFSYGDEDALVRAFNEQHLLTMDEFALNLRQIGKQEEAAAFFEVIEAAYHESLVGSALCIPRVICVGQTLAT